MSSPRVLVVDDDPLIRWAMTQTLHGSGCEVAEAKDARSALLQVARGADAPFDVILLDYWLPDSSDLGVLATMRSLAPDASIVLVSANVSPEIVDQAVRMGARAVLHKPFEMSRLMPTVLQASGPRAA